MLSDYRDARALIGRGLRHTYQTLLIVMVAFSEDNRAFVCISSIVCREAAFDFKSGTIGKLSVMTVPNPAGASAGKL